MYIDLVSFSNVLHDLLSFLNIKYILGVLIYGLNRVSKFYKTFKIIWIETATV